jgi:uncharacterized protein
MSVTLRRGPFWTGTFWTLDVDTVKQYIYEHDEFEWDDDKAAQNCAKHGVTFEHARRAFADPFGVGEIDDREDYGEDRFTRVGMVEGTLIFVAYTEREDRVRIITARRATKHEQDDYYEQNGQAP